MFITCGYNPVMSSKTPFGAALRHYRKKKKGLNQTRLGKAIGVTQAMISKLEKGEGDGSAEVREKIVAYFGKTYSEFISKGENLLGEKNITNITKYNQKHHEIIEMFQDPEKATLLNQMLVEIEKADPEGYDLIFGDIKKVYDTIKRLTEQKTGTEGE